MKIKAFIKKIIFGILADENTLIKYLKKNGAIIGNDVHFFSFRKMHIDTLNPHLLQIGNNVNIVASTILMHDYSWSVIKGMTGEMLGNQKPVYIGDNVFVGDGSIILGGSYIEGNCIVGARSVVTGKLNAGFVYAGNPAKPIMSIEEYIKKREKKQFEEAKVFVKKYIEAFDNLPPKDKLHEYFFLFVNDEKELTNYMKEKMKECGTYDLSIKYLKEHSPQFSSYESFLKACTDE